jgi:cathepsin L
MIKSLALLVTLVSVSFSHEFGPCKNSKVGDELGVQSVLFTPDPPVAGRTVQVQVAGKAIADIPQGDLHVEVRVLGITIVKEVLNMCDLMSCPIKAGVDYVAKVSQEIPGDTPDGIGATVRLSLVSSGTTVSCLESYVVIHQSSSDHKVIVGDEFLGPWKRIEKSLEFLFNKWKNQHPHVVPNFKVFGENMKTIVEHNILEDKTFTMTMNEFGSMTSEEFVNTRMGLRRPRDDVERNGPMKPRIQVLRSNVAQADPPVSVDWTTKGVVAEVKNQGSCGSCWAFSAVASLESAYALKTGKLVEFSEQELVSCDTADSGCSGGLMDTAFDWIERSSGGLCTESEYGYTSGVAGIRGECLMSTCTPNPDSVPKGYVDVPPNEAALMAAVAEHGPVSVAIEADQSAFQFYHSGVLTGTCGTHLDHGVLLAGYGVDATTGLKFWKVKNSWGSGWGEAGYIRILRGKKWIKGGECGIASAASYPVF